MSPVTMIVAYFNNAQTARMAKNGIEHLGIAVSDPIPTHLGLGAVVQRPFSLEITIEPPNVTLEDQAVGVIMRYNGVTSQGD